jgi:hypothetical protein
MKSEKRRHIRLLAKEGAYAALGTHFSKVGKLKDISRGGLAFRYINNTEDCVHDFSTVAIFVAENGFYLPDLSCRLIYDFPLNMTTDIQCFKTRFRIIRCGLKFTATTKYQLDKLEFFIDHYTRGLTPPKRS